MSFGAGHVQDMNNRMKQNRSQRPSKRAKFKENSRDPIYSSDKKPEKPIFKKVSEKELNLIKYKIREEAFKKDKKENIMNAIIFSILACSIALISLNSSGRSKIPDFARRQMNAMAHCSGTLIVFQTFKTILCNRRNTDKHFLYTK